MNTDLRDGLLANKHLIEQAMNDLMLFTQRTAYEAMPGWWKPVHRLLWAARRKGLIPNVAWRTYRRTWP